MKFDQQVLGNVELCKALMTAVVKTAAQATIEDAQLPVAKGGNMPVQTGFLRNSGIAAIGQLPQGESAPPDGEPSDDQAAEGETAKVQWSVSATVEVINRLQLGDTLFFGWTAEYAKKVEARRFFMRLAVQKWQANVSKAVNEANKRLNHANK